MQKPVAEMYCQNKLKRLVDFKQAHNAQQPTTMILSGRMNPVTGSDYFEYIECA